MGILDTLTSSLGAIKNFIGRAASRIKDILPLVRKSKLVGIAIDPEGKIHAVLSPNGVKIAVSSSESFKFEAEGILFTFDKEAGTYSINGKMA